MRVESSETKKKKKPSFTTYDIPELLLACYPESDAASWYIMVYSSSCFLGAPFLPLSPSYQFFKRRLEVGWLACHPASSSSDWDVCTLYNNTGFVHENQLLFQIHRGGIGDRKCPTYVGCDRIMFRLLHDPLSACMLCSTLIRL